MAIILPKLKYALNALSPHISEETLNFHYNKHHAGYVNKLNGLIKDTPFATKSLLEIMKESTGAIFNNAAQIWNHSFYWDSMGPNCGGEPHGEIKEKIQEDFGSFNNFKNEFSNVLCGHFGSGWGWLVLNNNNKLVILQTHDAGNPIKDNTGIPILTCDIWEHAYYIDYRNDRASYVKAWWNLVNWNFANENLKKALKK
ncbi:Superoxide dismutase [Plasmodium coatneyi]|uniref:Superoxide dismutase n=1 Tax=Plasmodium coatneyi TaxID=208452 RepID=A0A1B1E3V0_9APIC|nr:Superoxide dismutase [Plasmodium coatneyi]ANQ09610.1 Superoxide dismutase [Plasmodium coatneyi]